MYHNVLMWNNMEGEKEGERRRWGTSQDTRKNGRQGSKPGIDLLYCVTFQ